jgi:hypothetical protein
MQVKKTKDKVSWVPRSEMLHRAYLYILLEMRWEPSLPVCDEGGYNRHKPHPSLTRAREVIWAKAFDTVKFKYDAWRRWRRRNG